MSTISAGTTLTTALVQTGDTTGNLVIKTNNGNTTAATFSTAGNLTVAGTITANGSAITSSQWVTTGSNIYYSTGNVGIGTSSPSNLLTLGASGGPTQRFADTTSGVFSLIQNGSNGDFTISADHGNTGASTNIIFNSDGATERMRIDSSGNVLIGGSVSAARLYVVGANTSSGTLALRVQDSATSDLFFIRNSGDGYLSGNLGIGTSSPSYPLDIQKSIAVAKLTSTTTTAQAYFAANNGGGDFYIGRDNSAGSAFGIGAYASVLYSQGAYPMVFLTNSAERMRIDSSGNVGIGTSSPATKLHVNSSSGNAYTKIQTADAGAEAGVQLTNTAGDTYIYKNAANNNLAIYQNNADMFRITSAGLLQFNSGYGSAATAYGCRAWVNWNGTGSSSSIRGSGNVSSVTDNGTGDYTINFTTALVDTNYTANFSISSDDNGTFGNNGGTNTGVFSNFSSNVLVAPTTSAVRVGTSWTGAGRPNPTYCCVVVFR